MQPLPFTNLAASVALGIALAIFVIVQLVAGVRSLLSGGWRLHRADRFDRGSLVLLQIIVAIAVLAAAVSAYGAPFATIAPGLPAVRVGIFVIGIVLVIAGTAFREWAIITLGSSFTYDVRVVAGQRIISTGPYRFVRHPSYTGLLVPLAGFGLALGNWLGLAALVVLPVIGVVRRIRVEEQALITQLGEPYVEFAKTRKRLIPGIW